MPWLLINKKKTLDQYEKKDGGKERPEDAMSATHARACRAKRAITTTTTIKCARDSNHNKIDVTATFPWNVSVN